MGGTFGGTGGNGGGGVDLPTVIAGLATETVTVDKFVAGSATGGVSGGAMNVDVRASRPAFFYYRTEGGSSDDVIYFAIGATAGGGSANTLTFTKNLGMCVRTFFGFNGLQFAKATVTGNKTINYGNELAQGYSGTGTKKLTVADPSASNSGIFCIFSDPSGAFSRTNVGQIGVPSGKILAGKTDGVISMTRPYGSALVLFDGTTAHIIPTNERHGYKAITATGTIKSVDPACHSLQHSGAITLTLEALSKWQVGDRIDFVDDSGAAGTNAVTLAVQNGEKLNGTTNNTFSMNTNNGMWSLIAGVNSFYIK